MNPYAIIAALVLAIGIGAGGYLKGRHDEAADAIERERDALLAYAERIKQGQEQHDEDTGTINNLRTQLNRMRVTIPVCGSNADQNGASGVLSARVSEAFAEFRDETEKLLYRCDQLNIAAIRANHE